MILFSYSTGNDIWFFSGILIFVLAGVYLFSCSVKQKHHMSLSKGPFVFMFQVLRWFTHIPRCFTQWYCWTWWRSSGTKPKTGCGCFGEWAINSKVIYFMWIKTCVVIGTSQINKKRKMVNVGKIRIRKGHVRYKSTREKLWRKKPS